MPFKDNDYREMTTNCTKDKPERHRNYCITFWKKPCFPDKCDYLIHGEEVYPKTGNIHWQSYAEFPNGITRKTVKRRFQDETCHIEPRYGTQEDAIKYCKKDGKWEEFGEKKKQGERTDLECVAHRLLEGTSIREIAEENPTLYCKYRNGLKDLAGWGQQDASKEFRSIYTEVLWGDAGTGKTRKAIEDSDDYYILDMSANDAVWFDGYTGQKTLIIDDFYGWIKYGYLLRLLDGYQQRLPVKGSFTYARWNKVFITSNKHPKDWYHEGLTPALTRRISQITRK